MRLIGECLCGTVRYTVDGSIDEIAICHCSQCRRANGGAFNVGAPVNADRVTFERRDSIGEFQSSPGKFRAFCKNCGAPIYSRTEALPGVYRLRAGLITDLPKPKHLYQIHYDSCWDWTDDISGAPAQ